MSRRRKKEIKTREAEEKKEVAVRSKSWSVRQMLQVYPGVVRPVVFCYTCIYKHTRMALCVSQS